MLELFYDHNHHLLLGTFRSILTPGDLKLFDDTERRLVVEVGMRRGILDLACAAVPRRRPSASNAPWWRRVPTPMPWRAPPPTSSTISSRSS
jgi:hypothetical protein